MKFSKNFAPSMMTAVILFASPSVVMALPPATLTMDFKGEVAPLACDVSVTSSGNAGTINFGIIDPTEIVAKGAVLSTEKMVINFENCTNNLVDIQWGATSEASGMDDRYFALQSDGPGAVKDDMNIALELRETGSVGDGPTDLFKPGNITYHNGLATNVRHQKVEANIISLADTAGLSGTFAKPVVLSLKYH